MEVIVRKAFFVIRTGVKVSHRCRQPHGREGYFRERVRQPHGLGKAKLVCESMLKRDRRKGAVEGKRGEGDRGHKVK